MLTVLYPPIRGLLLLLSIGAACAPQPARVRVVARAADGQHRLRDVVLRSDPDLRTLSSALLQFRGGGALVIDGARFQGRELDLEQARQLTLEDAGRPVDLRFTVEGDVAIPDDHASLLMASAYHALEQVQAFLAAADVSLATRSTLQVCFHCSLQVDLGLPLPYLVSDNAAYVLFADVLALLPELVLDQVPLAMDAAILTHEVSHRVFRHNVYRGAALDLLLRSFADQPSMDAEAWRHHNLLMALNEGSADFLAASFAGDPRFADASLGALGAADQRDLEGARGAAEVYDPVFGEAASRRCAVLTASDGSHSVGSLDWSPYHAGTIWAGALWQLGRDDEGSAVQPTWLREQLVPALIGSLRELGEQLGSRPAFDFHLAIALLLDELPESRRERACAVFAARFSALMAEVPACH